MVKKVERWQITVMTLILGLAMAALSLGLAAGATGAGPSPVSGGKAPAAFPFSAAAHKTIAGPATLAPAAPSGTFNAVWATTHANDTNSIAWGDMDGDGDLDLAAGNAGVLNTQANRVYRNDGDNSFTDVTGGDLALDTDETRSIAWGDVDGDGDLDIVAGNYGQANKVYRNDGGGTFIDITGGDLALDTDDTTSIALGDMDGDGDLDLAAGNRDQANKVYRNDGGGSFNDASGGDLLTDFDRTFSIAWGDVDDDGDLDIVAGNYGQNKVYENEGGGSFDDITLGSIMLDLDDTTSIALGDVDADGYLDIVAGNLGQDKVYRNEGGGSFDDITSGDLLLASSNTTALDLGDMDGDGDLDVVTGGAFGSSNMLYRNDGSTFVDVTGGDLLFDSLPTYSIAWGDVDGDGDLDLAAGNSSDYVNVVYRNDGNGSFGDIGGGDLLPDVEQTNSIAWGDMDADGDLDLVAGNSSGEASKVYRNDGGGIFVDVTGGDLLEDADLTFSIAWGDIDGDGDLDLAAGNGSGDANKVYRNEGGGIFMDITGGDLLLDTGSTRSIAWGDMDGDGDLDLAAGNYNEVNKLYRNDGGGVFTDVTGGDLAQDADGTRSIAWGDMDGDGDLDLVAGNFGQNKVYRNDGNGIFSDVTAGDLALDSDSTESVVWGDIDGDGNLDLAAGNSSLFGHVNKLYRNDGGGHFTNITGGDLALDVEDSTSVALGDMDGDGDLDLVVGNLGAVGAPNKVFQNEGNGVFTDISGGDLLADRDPTLAIALGDADGDGDLDIVTGNSDHNKLYQNGRQGDSAVLPDNTPYLDVNSPYAATADFFAASGILDTPIIPVPYTLFDPEGDQVGQIKAQYSLNGGGKWETAVATPDTTLSNLGTLGRALQFDGVDDIVTVPDSPQINTSTQPHLTVMAWFKIVDTVVITGKQVIYEQGGANNGLDIYVYDGRLYAGGWSSDHEWANGTYLTAPVEANQWHHVALVISGTTTVAPDVLHLYLDGELVATGEGTGLPPHPGNIGIGAVAETTRFHDGSITGGGHAFGGIIDEVQIWRAALNAEQIQSRILGRQIEPDRSLLAAHWRFNKSAGYVATDWSDYGNDGSLGDGSSAQRPARRLAGQPYTFVWDTFASGFFGQSDNVVLRLEAVSPSSGNSSPDLYHYPDSVAGPFQRPSAAATTFPFRVRGTQVRAYTDTAHADNVLPGAAIFRVPGDNIPEGTFMQNSQTGQKWQTDPNGYLQGHGRLDAGDSLLAMYPITGSHQFTVYHTSASPTATGLDMNIVGEPGVQELVVSSDNPLILFNLLVSLEWDARNDVDFLAQLESDLQRTSEILFDMSNGQAALGVVRVYHDKGYWGVADVVIPASNSQRPGAILGGRVLTPTDELLNIGGEVITNTYLPGQIRMGSTWNRYGNPDGTLGEDWPRTLAHELGHYLFFLPDNYLGITQAGNLTLMNCPGSIMSDPYLYDELLTQAEWDEAGSPCQDTIAERYLGRSDWETVHQFYSGLNYTDAFRNAGPNMLPLAVTDIQFYAPPTATETIASPIFRLVDAAGNPAPIPLGQAQAYLIKRGGDNDPENDTVVAQGSPVGDQVNVRGAVPGDRICVYDHSQVTLRFGCVDAVGQAAEAISLQEVPSWEPQIQVGAARGGGDILTDTVTVTVTNVSPDIANLNVQILPALGRSSAHVAMNQTASGAFAQTVVAADGAFYGYARIWNPLDPNQEMLTEYVLIRDWGTQSLAWGTQSLAWGTQSLAWGTQSLAWGTQSLAWGAPAMSSDGQVIVLPLDDLFTNNTRLKLQKLASAPNLPAWLVPVGQAYRFESEGEEVPTSAILIRYIAGNVPAGQESGLRIYFSPDEGASWQRLETELDTYRNHASAQIQGEGLYVLISTVEINPSFTTGWNNFSYLIDESRPIPEALRSIEGNYSVVAHYDPGLPQPWLLYYPSVRSEFAGDINTLAQLAYPRSYWLYATQAVTLYLGPAGSGPTTQNALSSYSELQLPPATYYGWLTSTAGFSPAVGMPVQAWIDGTLCGETSVQLIGGRLAYIMTVVTGPPSGCGSADRTVRFQVGEWQMDHDVTWNNSQAWFHSLDRTVDSEIYLPVILMQ